MRPVLLALVMAISVACNPFAPDRQLVVRVVNAHNQAVVGAQVQVTTTDGNVFHTTDANGAATFTVSQNLSIDVAVSCPGYANFQREYPSISEDSTITVILGP